MIILMITIREEVEQKENIAALAVGQAKVDFMMIMMIIFMMMVMFFIMIMIMISMTMMIFMTIGMMMVVVSILPKMTFLAFVLFALKRYLTFCPQEIFVILSRRDIWTNFREGKMGRR